MQIILQPVIMQKIAQLENGRYTIAVSELLEKTRLMLCINPDTVSAFSYSDAGRCDIIKMKFARLQRKSDFRLHIKKTVRKFVLCRIKTMLLY